ncbi:hypothetical protein ACWEQ0_11545 [Nocardia thailandica]|uniref:Sensor domain-containing protein n=1 Tax=Nocardia thailandica TaxID=257275 RepID=A0ABW6PIY4_9NOCA|nr:hypothetical protein [Nocardia thailandica]
MDRVTRAVGAALAGCAVLGVSACGADEDTDTPAPPPAPPALGAAVPAAPGVGVSIPDSALLAAGLLGTTDLPSDFTALPPRTGSSVASGAEVAPTTPAECAKILVPLAAQYPGSTAAAQATYAGPDFSSIDIDAAAYPDAALAPAFASFQALVSRCASYSGADGTGIHIEYRAGALPQPPAGDASTAFQVNTSSEGLTLYSAVSLVQVGNTLVQIAVTAPSAVEPGVLTDVTAAQVRKLRGE